jgi:hypothetical protein
VEGEPCGDERDAHADDDDREDDARGRSSTRRRGPAVARHDATVIPGMIGTS